MLPAQKGHLPRLSPERYRGETGVFWTFCTEDRSTGWLDPAFHSRWQLLLLHACARFEVV